MFSKKTDLSLGTTHVYVKDLDGNEDYYELDGELIDYDVSPDFITIESMLDVILIRNENVALLAIGPEEFDNGE